MMTRQLRDDFAGCEKFIAGSMDAAPMARTAAKMAATGRQHSGRFEQAA
ncbi:hypothetical protein C8R32_102249 [Nitrosospira sp. Nsp5]|uniref:Uncharacterized protein n=1 Tax=Nitrosospira multiformis TaxID=1231 RepID=A0ABY0TK40_9PROT|nr:hypothetical protein C8R32_102249 [Nitrosospira sp. Nsp5]SDQ96107.1 hypothetical protein SAMN05216402_3007 [Nitrosospira multiformis]